MKTKPASLCLLVSFPRIYVSISRGLRRQYPGGRSLGPKQTRPSLQCRVRAVFTPAAAALLTRSVLCAVMICILIRRPTPVFQRTLTPGRRMRCGRLGTVPWVQVLSSS